MLTKANCNAEPASGEEWGGQGITQGSSLRRPAPGRGMDGLAAWPRLALLVAPGLPSVPLSECNLGSPGGADDKWDCTLPFRHPHVCAV